MLADTITLVLKTLFLGAERALAGSRRAAAAYLKTIVVLFGVLVVVPVPLIAAGVFAGVPWLVLAGGAWFGLWAAVLAVAAAPLGLLFESLAGGIPGSGGRYVRRARNFLIVGTGLAVCASVLPLSADPRKVPLLVMALAVLLLGGSSLIGRRIVMLKVTGLFLALYFSLFLPKTFRAVRHGVKGFDETLARQVERPTEIPANVRQIAAAVKNAFEPPEAPSPPTPPETARAAGPANAPTATQALPAQREREVRAIEVRGTAYAYVDAWGARYVSNQPLGETPNAIVQGEPADQPIVVRMVPGTVLHLLPHSRLMARRNQSDSGAVSQTEYETVATAGGAEMLCEPLDAANWACMFVAPSEGGGAM